MWTLKGPLLGKKLFNNLKKELNFYIPTYVEDKPLCPCTHLHAEALH